MHINDQNLINKGVLIFLAYTAIIGLSAGFLHSVVAQWYITLLCTNVVAMTITFFLYGIRKNKDVYSR